MSKSLNKAIFKSANWTKLSCYQDFKRFLSQNNSFKHIEPFGKKITSKKLMFFKTISNDAITIWALVKTKDSTVAECKVFLNGSDLLNSQLINEIVHSMKRTYSISKFSVKINSQLMTTSTGYCFRVAGWIADSESCDKQLMSFNC
ncbi:MAG: hypothetical protein ACK5OS_05445 [Chryseotalea sp.]|jgi:hypothetical protein